MQRRLPQTANLKELWKPQEKEKKKRKGWVLRYDNKLGVQTSLALDTIHHFLSAPLCFSMVSEDRQFRTTTCVCRIYYLSFDQILILQIRTAHPFTPFLAPSTYWQQLVRKGTLIAKEGSSKKQWELKLSVVRCNVYLWAAMVMSMMAARIRDERLCISTTGRFCWKELLLLK